MGEIDEHNQRVLDIAKGQAANTNVQQDYAAMQLAEQGTNLVKEQLGFSEELETIQYLLKGYTKEINIKEQVYEWKKPEDNDLIVLTDYGVHLIMNTIQFYMNKNTLLSNYTEELINKKMFDFSMALVDVIFMTYEKVFKYPTFEECVTVLKTRLDRKKELRKFSLELVGKQVDEEKIEKEFIEEIEGNIEKEITKIKEQMIKEKLKRFEILTREVQDAVHSTYLRAWNGQERKTLRQHIHVSENVGMKSPEVKRPSKNSFNFFKR